MQNLLSGLAGVLFVIGFLPYIASIWRGETKPVRVTWIIWLSLDYILIAGMYAEGTLNGQIIGVVLGGTVVLVLALLYGKPGWSKLDMACLGLAVLGIGLWGALDNPTLGILMSLTAGLIGSVPTFVSAWEDPSREDKTAWTIFFASCVLQMLAVSQWTLEAAGQPVVFFTIESIMVWILYTRPLPQTEGVNSELQVP